MRIPKVQKEPRNLRCFSSVQLVLRQNRPHKVVAKHVCLSPFYFQKGFGMLCGYTVSEYIRNRRLALAGGELTAGDVKIIDLARKEGLHLRKRQAGYPGRLRGNDHSLFHMGCLSLHRSPAGCPAGRQYPDFLRMAPREGDFR